MSPGFNNFNSNIGNQVIGTLNIAGGKEGEVAFIKQQLDLILEHTRLEALHSEIDMQKVNKIIDDFKDELDSKSPKKEILVRSLEVLETISSATSLIEQIRMFLKNVF